MGASDISQATAAADTAAAGHKIALYEEQVEERIAAAGGGRGWYIRHIMRNRQEKSPVLRKWHLLRKTTRTTTVSISVAG